MNPFNLDDLPKPPTARGGNKTRKPTNADVSISTSVPAPVSVSNTIVNESEQRKEPALAKSNAAPHEASNSPIANHLVKESEEPSVAVVVAPTSPNGFDMSSFSNTDIANFDFEIPQSLPPKYPNTNAEQTLTPAKHEIMTNVGNGDISNGSTSLVGNEAIAATASYLSPQPQLLDDPFEIVVNKPFVQLQPQQPVTNVSKVVIPKKTIMIDPNDPFNFSDDLKGMGIPHVGLKKENKMVIQSVPLGDVKKSPMLDQIQPQINGQSSMLHPHIPTNQSQQQQQQQQQHTQQTPQFILPSNTNLEPGLLKPNPLMQQQILPTSSSLGTTSTATTLTPAAIATTTTTTSNFPETDPFALFTQPKLPKTAGGSNTGTINSKPVATPVAVLVEAVPISKPAVLQNKEADVDDPFNPKFESIDPFKMATTNAKPAVKGSGGEKIVKKEAFKTADLLHFDDDDDDIKDDDRVLPRAKMVASHDGDQGRLGSEVHNNHASKSGSEDNDDDDDDDDESGRASSVGVGRHVEMSSNGSYDSSDDEGTRHHSSTMRKKGDLKPKARTQSTSQELSVGRYDSGGHPSGLLEGHILGRVSTRSLFVKDWAPMYWVLKEGVLVIYRKKEDADPATRSDPKKRIPITSQLRVLNIKQKQYAKLGILYNFMLEEIQDWGPVNIAKFGSQNKNAVELLWTQLRAAIGNTRRSARR